MSHKFLLHKLPSPLVPKKGGFVLLLTMLIVSVILSISLSILSVTIKEVQLANFLRQSEKAFIAANRALECTLFWDRALPAPNPGALQYSPFATSSVWTASSLNMANVTCHNGAANVRLDTLAWSVSNLTSTTGTTAFTITFSDGTSAEVRVEKISDDTIVTASGYNTSVVSNPRRTQRTLVARYNL